MANQANNSSYLRATFQGGQGSGKSLTAALLALGISVHYCDRAPVFSWDTEKDWEFYKLMFAAENVELIHRPSRSFKSLAESLQDAASAGACVHVCDQMAVPWRDLLTSFSDDSGFISMAKQNQLRGHWDEFVYEWRELPMHAIACGRLGYEFMEYEEDGHLKFAKGDTKMRAGGAESFGYEGSLECEFTRWQEEKKDNAAPRKRKKILSHICTVLKDRTRTLNGSQFIFKDFTGYKPGDFRRVLKEFIPHLEFLRQVSTVSVPREDSRELVHTDSWWQRQDLDRRVLIEEWDSVLASIADGQSTEAKTLRRLIQENITSLRSRTQWERLPLEQMRAHRLVMLAVEKHIKAGDIPVNEREIGKLVEVAREEVVTGQPGPSLLEVNLRDSLPATITDAVLAPMRRKAQKVTPIVPSAEQCESVAQGD